MYHFTTTIQYVCKEREKQPENDNIDNDNSLHPEGLLFFWHRPKLISYTRLDQMKLPIFGCSWPTKTAISCGPIYIYSFNLWTTPRWRWRSQAAKNAQKNQVSSFSAEPPSSGLALTPCSTVRVSQDTLGGGISHQPEHQGRTRRIALIQFIPRMKSPLVSRRVFGTSDSVLEQREQFGYSCSSQESPHLCPPPRYQSRTRLTVLCLFPESDEDKSNISGHHSLYNK